MNTKLRDQINHADRQRTSQAAFGTISAVQDELQGEQMAALACAFILLCRRFNARPQDVFSAAENLMRTHDQHMRPEFQAIRDYFGNEW
jgi:hypothetical protein